MRISIIIFVYSILIFSQKSHAQHSAIYSQYLFNPIVISPADAGSAKALRMVMHYRKQWIGFDKDVITPSQMNISIDTPLRNKKISLGSALSFERFTSNVFTNQIFIVNYKFKLTQTINMTVAGQTGYLYQRTSYEDLVLINANDPTFNNNYLSSFNAQIGLGLKLETKKFYWSATIPQKFLMVTELQKEGTIYANIFYMLAGAKLKISDQIHLRPNILWRYIQYQKTNNIDLNLLADYKQNFTVGLSYRHKNALVALIQVQFNQLSLGYAYDYNINALSQFQFGSHEVALKYVFRYGLKAYNPKSFKY